MSTRYRVIRDAEALRQAVETLSAHQVIGLDTETIDLDAFANGNLKNNEALNPLKRLLEAARPIKIAHNAKFDAKFIKHTLGVDLGGLFDTLLASQIVGAGDIEERHGLETVASRYLNEAVDKTERLSNWNFELSEAQLEIGR